MTASRKIAPRVSRGVHRASRLPVCRQGMQRELAWGAQQGTLPHLGKTGRTDRAFALCSVIANCSCAGGKDAFLP